MPTRDSNPTGAPCWVDLYTSDPDKSKAFYNQLFGWTAEAPNEQFGGYVNFSKGGHWIAGCMQNDGQSGTPDGWNIYLSVTDAAATLAAAEKRGGQTIVPAMQVGDLGTMGMLLDAGQAVIGLWQPGTHLGFHEYDEPGTPGWFELHTRAYDASVDFYRDVFKWDTHAMSDSPEFRYTTLGKDEGALAGIMDAASFLPEGTPSHWSVYFRVDDTDVALKETVNLGGAIVQPAEDTPYGRLAGATDPTGAFFKLLANT